MFLLGLSGSFIPYILAFFFSLILLGNSKVVASENQESSAVVKNISHQVHSSVDAAKCIHFFASAVAPDGYCNKPLLLSSHFDWELPHRLFTPVAGFLLIPNRRGPPQF